MCARFGGLDCTSVSKEKAAAVVQRVFDLYEQGNGKIRIARLLNEEGIPCPSEYKTLNGERYSHHI